MAELLLRPLPATHLIEPLGQAVVQLRQQLHVQRRVAQPFGREGTQRPIRRLVILDQAQAQHLLGDRSQAEALQAHQACGNLGVKQRGGNQPDLAQVRQILQAVVQEPDVVDPRRQGRQIGQGVRVDQERADVLTAYLHQVGVGAIAKTLRALDIERDRCPPECKRFRRVVQAGGGIDDGGGAPAWLCDNFGIIRVADRQAAAIVDSHSDSFKMTGGNDAGRPAHHVGPSV